LLKGIVWFVAGWRVNDPTTGVRDNATLYLVPLQLAKLPAEWSQEYGAQHRFTRERLCRSNATRTPPVNFASCGFGYRIRKLLTTQSVPGFIHPTDDPEKRWAVEIDDFMDRPSCNHLDCFPRP
jgi:hypothetical protein